MPNEPTAYDHSSWERLRTADDPCGVWDLHDLAAYLRAPVFDALIENPRTKAIWAQRIDEMAWEIERRETMDGWQS